MAIIVTENLCHDFSDGTQALKDISLSFNEGEFTIIAGANGSGKTTLLRHLNGLLYPSSGAVTVCGISVEKDPLAARRQVGMVFQDADSQIVGETVFDDAAFGPENLRLKNDEIRKRVTRSLAAVNLTGYEEKRPHLLSGGEKRRLAIAGILAMEPKVLLMDEPLSNLDYPAAQLVIKQIVALQQCGHTIILTTHDLEKVLVHAQRLVVMERGRVVEDGAPDEVVEGIQRYGIRPPCSVQLGMGIRSWVN